MIQPQTLVKITDNTGARIGRVFKVLGGSKRRYARIGDVVIRKLKPGETLMSVSRQEPGVPLWLLQRYNTHLELHAPRPGTELRIPKVVSRVS